jgi:hypothetical protein
MGNASSACCGRDPQRATLEKFHVPSHEETQVLNIMKQITKDSKHETLSRVRTSCPGQGEQVQRTKEEPTVSEDVLKDSVTSGEMSPDTETASTTVLSAVTESMDASSAASVDAEPPSLSNSAVQEAQLEESTEVQATLAESQDTGLSAVTVAETPLEETTEVLAPLAQSQNLSSAVTVAEASLETSTEVPATIAESQDIGLSAVAVAEAPLEESTEVPATREEIEDTRPCEVSVTDAPSEESEVPVAVPEIQDTEVPAVTVTEALLEESADASEPVKKKQDPGPSIASVAEPPLEESIVVPAALTEIQSASEVALLADEGKVEAQVEDLVARVEKAMEDVKGASVEDFSGFLDAEDLLGPPQDPEFEDFQSVGEVPDEVDTVEVTPQPQAKVQVEPNGLHHGKKKHHKKRR